MRCLGVAFLSASGGICHEVSVSFEPFVGNS